MKPEDELPVDNRYYISEAGDSDWDGARSQCRSRGAGWDLAVIDDKREHQKILQMTNCADYAFWVGATEQNGLVYDINDKLVCIKLSKIGTY